jgi:kynurenine formamidase
MAGPLEAFLQPEYHGYWGTDRNGDTDHQYLSSDAAELLVDGGVSRVGIDTVNIDDTRGRVRPPTYGYWMRARQLEVGGVLVSRGTRGVV